MRNITFNSADAEACGMKVIESPYWAVGLDGEDELLMSYSYEVGGLNSPIVLGICWAKDTPEARQQLNLLGIQFQTETETETEDGLC